MENNILDFVTKFFSNLGAKISFLNGELIIQDVSKEFEKYYGKKSPYKFVFSPEFLKEDFELIDKSNYLLKTISNYLEEAGQTTLLKLEIHEDFSKDMNKFISLPNSKIKKFYPKKKFNSFFRFTFHTSFQYLNENEKIINEFFVSDGKVVKGNLSGYPVVEGKKTEIKINDPKEAYFLAKENLKLQLLGRTQELSRLLNKKLEAELFRMEEHFKHEKKEHEDKVLKQSKNGQHPKESFDYEELEKEKQRSMQIEKQKHMLNINNKLFNTTLIYYPLFCSRLILENDYASREIEISIDPLTKKLIPFKCENCNEDIKEIFLCTTGHAICKKCAVKCESCSKMFCKKCLFRKCELCNKLLCKDCYTRCSSCGKLMCKTHVKEDNISKRTICKNCLSKCERCGEFKDPSGFRTLGKIKVCELCFRKEMQRKTMKGIFDK
jgi:hypothetical protein